ncbi:HD domain-containing protein [bacterium]|nr:HD domain-containing protein [bacterium]
MAVTPDRHERISEFKYTLLQICAGVSLNLILANLALYFKIPLYLDSLGTILAAMLGGANPAIMVGFFSNAINGISSIDTLYYGIISILIAVFAAYFQRKKYFRSIPGIFLAIITFSIIGGGLGSVLTWFLYGFGFGEGISAPLVNRIWASGFSESKFLVQLLSDFLLDSVDKLIVVVLALVIYHFIPKKIILTCEKPSKAYRDSEVTSKIIRYSLFKKVVSMVVIAEIVLGVLACLIGFFLYREVSIRNYTDIAVGVTSTAASLIDADSVDRFLAEGRNAADYVETETNLYNIRGSFEQVKFIYVYKILPDGCHVVFDLDVEGFEASEVGEVVPFDESFADKIPTLLAGGEIEPLVTDDTYGWLLTVYKPIKNKENKVVAYVAADISMEQILSDDAVFFIKTLSLFFGISIIIMSIVLELAKRGIIIPVNAMANASLKFAFNSENKQSESLAYMESLKINTFDEIENLYIALSKMARDSVAYIDEVKQQAEQISEMQEEIIMGFAEMVEARDQNTGDHIKKTALYVRRIAEEMQKEHIHEKELTNDYISTLSRSAPLHDIGKIKISDLVLNKPGRLTDDEFAIMKSHAEEGCKILQKIADTAAVKSDYLNEAIDMAHYHHEKWDGSGYPSGIKGEQIPLSARIMAVADVFDALIAERAYKKAFTYEKAMQIITEGSGTHFDPEVVSAFVKISKELYSERTLLPPEHKA